MMVRCIGVGHVVGLAVLVIALAVTGGVAQAATVPAWQRALNVRSVALDRAHGLAPVRVAATRPGPDWLTALMVRSKALDARYGVGKASARELVRASDPRWYKALLARSDALDRTYHLGAYAG